MGSSSSSPSPCRCVLCCAKGTDAVHTSWVCSHQASPQRALCQKSKHPSAVCRIKWQNPVNASGSGTLAQGVNACDSASTNMEAYMPLTDVNMPLFPPAPHPTPEVRQTRVMGPTTTTTTTTTVTSVSTTVKTGNIIPTKYCCHRPCSAAFGDLGGVVEDLSGRKGTLY